VHYTEAEARRVLLWLIGLELAFVFVYLVVHVWSPGIRWGPVRPWFDLDSDKAIPAWFSSVQLFSIATVLFLAARNNQQRHRLPSAHLLAGSVLFLYLSADEGARIHEQITVTAKALGLDWLLFHGTHGAWIPVYAAIALLIVAALARHLWRFWLNYRRESLIAMGGAAVFAAGGVATEIVGYRLDTARVAYKLEVAAEEFLEMSGVSIMLRAALQLARNVAHPSEPEGASPARP
jgi:hypothetical protein